MKSIFLIHSHITLLSSISVIQEFKIIKPILLFTGDYEFPENVTLEYVSYRLPPNISYLSNVPTSGFGKAFRLIQSIIELDKFINKLTKCQQFNLYLPHSKNFLFQALLTNPKCNLLNYIDEGLLSYTSNFHKNKYTGKINWVKFLIKYLYKERTNVYRTCHKNYSTLYRFVQGQDKVPTIKQISWPVIDITNVLNLTGQKVLVLDNPIYGGVCNEDDYIQYFKQIAICFNGEKLFIKKHPRDIGANQIIKVLESNNIQYSIIQDNEVLELSLLNSKDVTVIGGWSSILLYASSMGHEVISFIPTINRNSEKAKTWIQLNIPGIFYNSKIKLM